MLLRIYPKLPNAGKRQGHQRVKEEQKRSNLVMIQEVLTLMQKLVSYKSAKMMEMCGIMSRGELSLMGNPLGCC